MSTLAFVAAVSGAIAAPADQFQIGTYTIPVADRVLGLCACESPAGPWDAAFGSDPRHPVQTDWAAAALQVDWPDRAAADLPMVPWRLGLASLGAGQDGWIVTHAPVAVTRGAEPVRQRIWDGFEAGAAWGPQGWGVAAAHGDARLAGLPERPVWVQVGWGTGDEAERTWPAAASWGLGILNTAMNADWGLGANDERGTNLWGPRVATFADPFAADPVETVGTHDPSWIRPVWIVGYEPVEADCGAIGEMTLAMNLSGVLPDDVFGLGPIEVGGPVAAGGETVSQTALLMQGRGLPVGPTRLRSSPGTPGAGSPILIITDPQPGPGTPPSGGGPVTGPGGTP
ncbi:hypothetical protein HKCCE3408_19300, partial [Rhodobacterales bacterium HKCCE3408]|nr:hypothetical protein [Rhodobacterales bacterium HKCCE3408]